MHQLQHLGFDHSDEFKYKRKQINSPEGESFCVTFQAGVDVGICATLLQRGIGLKPMSEFVAPSVIVLLAGEGDFHQPLKICKDFGKTICLCFSNRSISGKLRQLAHGEFILEDNWPCCQEAPVFTQAQPYQHQPRSGSVTSRGSPSRRGSETDGDSAHDPPTSSRSEGAQPPPPAAPPLDLKQSLPSSPTSLHARDMWHQAFDSVKRDVVKGRGKGSPARGSPARDRSTSTTSKGKGKGKGSAKGRGNGNGNGNGWSHSANGPTSARRRESSKGAKGKGKGKGSKGKGGTPRTTPRTGSVDGSGMASSRSERTHMDSSRSNNSSSSSSSSSSSRDPNIWPPSRSGSLSSLHDNPLAPLPDDTPQLSPGRSAFIRSAGAGLPLPNPPQGRPPPPKKHAPPPGRPPT
jgi:hypothetical protein